MTLLDTVVVAVVLAVVHSDCAFEVRELAHATCLRIRGDPITMALVTVASGLPDEFVRGLRRNRLRYVAAHPTTEYCEYNATLDASRPLAWTKVRALEQIFARADAPAIATWIDADALIMDRAQSFEEVAGRDVTLAVMGRKYARGEADQRALPNTGVLVARNTPWTRSFLRAVYAGYPEAWASANFEQAAIHLYAQRRAVDFARHATIVPYERLNSPTAAYKPGDFVCHHAGRRGAAAKYIAMVDAFRMGDVNQSKCCAQPCARTPG